MPGSAEDPDTLDQKRNAAKAAFGQRPARREAKYGALAQLGERLICIQEVIGSIPIGSTNPPRLTVWRAKWVGSSGG